MAVTNFYVTLTENSWSQSKNTSSVTARVYITTTNSYNLLGTAKGTIRFGGNASGSYSFTGKFGTYATTQIYSRTFTVNHNVDGSGTVTCNVSFNTRVSAGTVTASKSLTLHKIPRASTPSVSGTKELGNTLTLNMNRATSSYTHTVKWAWAGQSGTIGTGIGASTTWTPPVTLATSLTNAASATCTLTTTTYNGSTVIGTTTATFTLAIPSSYKPTISSVSFEDTEGYYENYGAFIGEKSIPKVTVTASSVSGATIASYTVTLGKVSATGSSPVTLTAPELAPQYQETRTLKVVATDTRGRTATWSQSVTVANYFPSEIGELWAKRWNTTDNREDDESTTVRVYVKSTLFQVNGVGTTTGTVKIEYKQPSDYDYTVSSTQSVTNTIDNYFDVENCDSAKVWQVRVTISDAFGTDLTYSITIPTATPIMDLRANGKGLAFFGVSRFDGVHFNGDVTLTNSDGTGAALRGYSGQEEPYYLLHTYPQAGNPTGAPNLRVGGMQDAETYEMKRINALELYWDKYLAGDIGSLLWVGTWSSGTVTVPNAHKYRMFLIRSGNASSQDLGTVIAMKALSSEYDENEVSGIGGTNNGSNNSQIIYSFYAKTSGSSDSNNETWTLQRNNYLNHNASTSHSAGATRPVWEIRGLL